MTKIKFNINGVNVEMEKDEVSKAMEAGEIKVTTDKLLVKSEDLITYSKADFEVFKKNLGDDEYKKGKVAGEEMAVKAVRDEYGLDFEGKTVKNFAEAFKTKVLTEAKVEPSKKIQELEDDKMKLQKNLAEKTQEFEAFKTDVTTRETRSRKDSFLTGLLPEAGLRVSKKVTLLALKDAGIDVDFGDNGTPTITVNGQVQKDEKTLDPVKPGDFINARLSTLDLLASASGGTGGGDEGGGAASGGYDAFVKEMEKAGKSEGSQAFNEEMSKRISAGTLKM